MSRHKKITRNIIYTLVALWAIITVLKFGILDYDIAHIFPKHAYRIGIDITAVPGEKKASVKHFLAPSRIGQKITNEKVSGNFERYEIAVEGQNRVLNYLFSPGDERRNGHVQFLVETQEITFELPDVATIDPAEEYLREYLSPTELIQSESSEIVSLAKQIDIADDDNLVAVVKKVYDFCYNEIESRSFSGVTDAVLTAQLGEASCNGKSRLMVALLRHKGIPSRLVGGFIMGSRERKKTTHQWVEVMINEHWVPFCPLNGYFAKKPAHYLSFYLGDYSFFSHTKQISFDYQFQSDKEIVPVTRDRGISLDMVPVWERFRQSGITLGMMTTVLVIPLGALITIVFRNVLGVKSFGTFLPALIAYSFLSTGFWWGAGVFSLILTIGVLINFFLDRLRLLHVPKLTVIMVIVALMLIGIGYVGIVWGNRHMAYSLFFPLAILSLTIERFFSIVQERGVKYSTSVYLWSLVIVAFCYIVMRSVFIQVLLVMLPELYLLVIAASLYLGHWTGLRVNELFRFRHLIKEQVKEN